MAVGIYFGLRPLVGSEEVGWMCILGAAPFAACGFFKYHGMTAEKLAWAWFKSEFLYPKKLVFQSESGVPSGVYDDATERGVQDFQYRMKMNANGIADDETLDAIYAPDAMVRMD